MKAGITPYINASIIMQLMTVVLPQLEELAKKGGEEGRKKISQYTRWLTIVLAVVQASTMARAMSTNGVFYDTSVWFIVYAVIAFVSGNAVSSCGSASRLPTRASATASR